MTELGGSPGHEEAEEAAKRRDAESSIDWILRVHLPVAMHLPEQRTDFPKNHIATTEVDRAQLDEEEGRPFADAWLNFQVSRIPLGGVSPNVNDVLFPKGLDGALDLDEARRILANCLIWKA